jgi:hypothetical protein
MAEARSRRRGSVLIVVTSGDMPESVRELAGRESAQRR